MSDAKVAVVLKARNEEEHIAEVLRSLGRQTLRPYRTIVVNDGSTDGTSAAIEQFAWVERIDNPPRAVTYLAQKELASTVNQGLERLDMDESCQYICLADGDIWYPPEYTRTITARMEADSQLAITSGVVQGEFSIVPRGAGRMVRCEFWRKVGLRYPVNYGYEGYLLVKASSMGYQNAVFNDLIMMPRRRTGGRFSPSRYYYYGVAMRALGYRSWYAWGAAALKSRRSMLGGLYMLRGYYSKYNNLYENDLREYVRSVQSGAVRTKILKAYKTLRSAPQPLQPRRDI